MICPIEMNPYSGLDLSVFNHNLSLPRHRWYEFKEGFSEKLVQTAISEVGGHSRKRLNILDPFAGSGTSLVTAGRMGLNATGIEVNPYLSFAAKAKCTPSSNNRQLFRQQLSEILFKSRHEVTSPLEGISTFTKSSHNKKWLFNKSVLRGFAAIDNSLKKYRRFRKPLRLALFASLMECCNAKRDGKCLRYKKDWETRGDTSSDLRDIFKKRAEIVFDDMSIYPFDANGLISLQGDTRVVLKTLKSRSYDLIVTSPPYLNSFDYSDVYRPELFVGGFVNSNDELRQIRLRTVRSHVQVNWEPSSCVSSPMIAPIVERLETKQLWSSKLPAMIQSYFADMTEVLTETYRLIRANGQAWIVVSTSAYGGVEVPVDLILADIASQVGWRLRSVNVLRQMRAAGQHWSHLEPDAKLPLRESLIILERKK